MPSATLTLYALFPFSLHEIVVSRPLKKGYTENPQNIGNHLRNRRLKLRLSIPKAANLFGVNKSTLFKWEDGTKKPSARHRAKIVEFLGYELDK